MLGQVENEVRLIVLNFGDQLGQGGQQAQDPDVVPKVYESLVDMVLGLEEHVIGWVLQLWILFGDRFGAQEAREAGIAWRVVPENRVFDEARAVAERIASLPERQASDFKRVINRACHLDVEGAMALETDATVRSFLDPDTAGRVAAFGER